jgi:hypothetical protein
MLSTGSQGHRPAPCRRAWAASGVADPPACTPWRSRAAPLPPLRRKPCHPPTECATLLSARSDPLAASQCVQLADSCLALGADSCRSALALLHSAAADGRLGEHGSGARVIYGHTDSLFLALPSAPDVAAAIRVSCYSLFNLPAIFEFAALRPAGGRGRPGQSAMAGAPSHRAARAGLGAALLLAHPGSLRWLVASAFSFCRPR